MLRLIQARTVPFLLATALIPFLGCGNSDRPRMAPLPEGQTGMETSTETPAEAAQKGLNAGEGAAPVDGMGLGDY